MKKFVDPFLTQATFIKPGTINTIRKWFVSNTIIMSKAFTGIPIIILIVFIAISCSKSGTTGGNNNGGGGGGGGGSTVNCTTVSNKSFAADVNPIIQATCNVATCHNAGSINGPGPLTSYTEIFNARAAIRQAVSTGVMPKSGSLTTAQKNSIICWVDNGALNN